VQDFLNLSYRITAVFPCTPADPKPKAIRANAIGRNVSITLNTGVTTSASQSGITNGPNSPQTHDKTFTQRRGHPGQAMDRKCHSILFFLVIEAVGGTALIVKNVVRSKNKKFQVPVLFGTKVFNC